MKRKPTKADLVSLAMVRRSAWIAACQFDGIDPAAKAAVFSKDNPFVPAHNLINRQLRQAIERNRRNGIEGNSDSTEARGTPDP